MADLMEMLKNQIYNIPEKKTDRDNIKSLVKEYVREKGLTPPLAIEELFYHSNRISDLNKIENYEKFIMIVLNNEIWKDILISIPYERRILLLPQCLRNQKLCKGYFDELGLICEQCGNCCLGELQEKAINLGYSVLISEGTQVVINLIEKGNFDAVIGVSCISVMEHSFKYIFNGLIPGYAVPLYKDGCSDTAMDIDWLNDIIESFNNKHKYIIYNNIKEEIEDIFKFNNLIEFIDNKTKTADIGVKWMAKSGNRWRPLLLASVYRSLMSDSHEFPLNIRKVIIAIECFHKASLIHDDIEDKDDFRYAEETLHKEYNMQIALNAGDYLLGEGYRLLSESGFDKSTISAIINIASRGHRDLSLGQGEELYWLYNPCLISIDQVLNIFRLKTSPAFEVALLTGAILANTDNEVKIILEEFSEYLGIAYQIKDDIKDSIIGEKRPTIVNTIFLEECDDNTKEKIKKSWSIHKDYIFEGNEFSNIKNKVFEKANNLMVIYKEKALKSIYSLKNINLKILLNKILFKIIE